MLDLGTTDATYESRDLAAMLARVDRSLEATNLQLRPSSRFAIHRARLASAVEGGEEAVSAPLVAHRGRQQAIFDLAVLDLITAELKPLHRWMPLIQLMLGGNDHPWRDKNDLARNSEFELYLAGVLHRAGYRVRPAEPDLLIDDNGWSLGVAAKRLRSAKRFRERLEEGIDQLKRARVPGFVMIDASVACLSRQEVVRASNTTIVAAAVESILKNLVAECTVVFERHTGSPHFLGAMATAFIPCVLPSKGAMQFCVMGSRHWNVMTNPDDSRHNRVVQLARRVAKVRVI